MGELTVDEILEHLRLALTGVMSISPCDPAETIRTVFNGDVEYWIGGWRFRFFIDNGELDYVDSVIAHDLRDKDLSESGEFVFDELSQDEFDSLVALL